MERVCPHCGSPRLIVDGSSGTLVCQRCGAVIMEALIDEAPPPRKPWEPLSPKPQRPRRPPSRTPWEIEIARKARKAIASGRVFDRRSATGTLITYTTLIVESSVDEKVKALAHDIRKALASSTPPAVIKRKTSIALALYVMYRARGSTKMQALRRASGEASAKQERLEKLEREYRHLLEAMIDRVRKEWLGKSRTAT